MQLTSPPFTGSLTTGQFLAVDGTAAAPSYAFISQVGLGWYRTAANQMSLSTGSAPRATLSTTFIATQSGGSFAWSSTSSSTGGQDTSIDRAAAGVIRLANAAGAAGGLSAVAKTPTSLAGNTNDYSPGVGWFQRWSAAPAVNVTGMVAGVDGETRLIWNVGANNITLTNADVLSAAANRFTTATGAALVLTPNKCAFAVYDTTSAVWRVTLLP